MTLTEEAGNSLIFSSFPEKFTAFHWHGDTFEIPPRALRIAESEGCENQAFESGRVIGLQFHLEYSEGSIDLMFKNCGDEIVEGKYIQKPEVILSQISMVNEMQRILNLLLDKIESGFGEP